MDHAKEYQMYKKMLRYECTKKELQERLQRLCQFWYGAVALRVAQKINERINMNYHIEIKDKKQLDLLMQCIQKAYLPYGQELPDEDVYAINCEIDEVMQQVKKAEYK